MIQKLSLFHQSLIHNTVIKLISVQYTENPWDYHEIFGDFNRIYIIYDGTCNFLNRDENITINKNSGIFIASGINFHCVSRGSFKKLSLHFRIELPTGEDIFQIQNIKKFYIPDKKKLFIPHTSAIALCKNTNSLDVFRITGLLYNLLSENISGSFDIKKHFFLTQKYAEVFKYTRENYSAETSIKSIAARMYKSSAGFSRDFKRDIGLSPKKFFFRQLMLRAKYLLNATDKKIKEIAADLKFTDEYYFSRIFRQHTGFSPTEYRRKTQ